MLGIVIPQSMGLNAMLLISAACIAVVIWRVLRRVSGKHAQTCPLQVDRGDFNASVIDGNDLTKARCGFIEHFYTSVYTSAAIGEYTVWVPDCVGAHWTCRLSLDGVAIDEDERDQTRTHQRSLSGI